MAAQQRDQRCRLDGFPEQRRDAVPAQLAGTDGLAVARVQNDRELGPIGREPLREFEAGHPRHRLIGKDEIDTLVEVLKEM